LGGTPELNNMNLRRRKRENRAIGTKDAIELYTVSCSPVDAFPHHVTGAGSAFASAFLTIIYHTPALSILPSAFLASAEWIPTESGQVVG
jgi:hypothetical protein